MRRTCRTLCLLSLLLASGCFAHINTVGEGPQGGEVRVVRHWYGMWGFAPLRRTDARNTLGPVEDFRVTTRFGAGDVFVNLFTGPLGFFRQTVKYEK